MTREEFLHYYFENGSVQEVELECNSDWGCVMDVVVLYKGKYYRGQVTQMWGEHDISNLSIFREPTEVVPQQVVVTEYVDAKDAKPSDVDTLINEAEYVADLALQFTHPQYSDTYPEWSAVYSLAESTIKVLSRKEEIAE